MKKDDNDRRFSDSPGAAERTVARRRFLSRSLRLAAAASAAPLMARGAGRAEERIRIGQIGVGHGHADGKMRVLRRSPDYEVIGVVEPDPELRKEAEGRGPYRDLRWMELDELLGTPGLRAAAVETRVEDLLETAEACVDAGLHIHLDKPAGSSLPHFRRILEKARSKRLALQMGYMYRYNPAVVLLREVLAKGWLGEPFEVHAVMSKVVGAEARRRLAEHPGGILFELGCHLIDLLVGLLGRPAAVTPFQRHSAAAEDGLADNMLAVCEYPRALATIRSTALEVEGFARRHFVVCGTEGTFHIQPLDAPKARLALARDRGRYRRGYQEIDFPEYTRYVDDLRDLARMIRGEKEADFSYEHDLAVQETVLRACGLDAE